MIGFQQFRIVEPFERRYGDKAAMDGTDRADPEGSSGRQRNPSRRAGAYMDKIRAFTAENSL